MRTLEEIENDIRKIKVENTKLRDIISDNEKKIDALNEEKVLLENKDTIEFCEKKLIGKIVKKVIIGDDGTRHEIYTKVKSWNMNEEFNEEVEIHGESIGLIYEGDNIVTYYYDKNMVATLLKYISVESVGYFGCNGWEEITENEFLEAKVKIREI